MSKKQGSRTARGVSRQRAKWIEHLFSFPEDGIETGAGRVMLMQSVDDDNVIVILLDGIESSALHLTDPTVLDFEYMDVMTRMLTALRPPSREPALRALHLGGAACALPRAWADLYDGSRQLVAEIDERLAALARDWFDVPRSPKVRIRVADGRAAVESQHDGAWDVVVRDAFDRGIVPPTMRTRQFVEQVDRVLAPGGWYLVNMADRAPLRTARIEAATLRERFTHVIVVSDPAVLSGRRFGNLVFLATHSPIDVAEVDRALRGFPLPLRVLSEAETADFASQGPLDDADLAADEPQPRLDAHPDEASMADEATLAASNGSAKAAAEQK